jgi:predicted Zn-dependent protease
MMHTKEGSMEKRSMAQSPQRSPLASIAKSDVPQRGDEKSDDRFISRATFASIVHQLIQRVQMPGQLDVTISSWWNGEVRWARNSVVSSSDRRDIQVGVMRRVNGFFGQAITNQIDESSLEALMQEAEYAASLRAGVSYPEFHAPYVALPTPSPKIWSDATVVASSEDRNKLAHVLSNGAEQKGMISAGYLETRGSSYMRFIINDDFIARLKSQPVEKALAEIEKAIPYHAYTQAHCSMTVRHPKGTGSGWAGLSGFDWSQIDAGALAEQALDKCLKSIDPVRIEPGRYTVILEPQAVSDLLDGLMYPKTSTEPLSRIDTERGQGPFVDSYDSALGLIRTRLGLRVMDDRITISHDPMDPQLGIIPEPGLAPVTLIENGVLKTLWYERDYAVVDLYESNPALRRVAYRMSGGTATIPEMISTTKRGLLVTRFWNLRVMDISSLLMTGVTRDGLWLIENGKITRAVKNMRVTESPLFVLNNVEQLGTPVPVFRPAANPFESQLTPAIVPPIKANDFSFTSTIDAI